MWFGPIKAFFSPRTPKEIKRLQYFWAGGIGLLCLLLSYIFVSLFFGTEPRKEISSRAAEEPTAIETASSKVDLNEMWRHKVEDENRKIKEDLTALKTLFQEGVKQSNETNDKYTQDLETKITELEDRLSSQISSKGPETIPSLPFSSPQGAGLPDGQQQASGISKFSLNLNGALNRKNSPEIKSVNDFIPAGAFARTVLLSGLDASSAMNASSDPRPILLRIIDPGTLPRRFQSDLKDCHCLAAAYGDLSSERIYARLEKLTCVAIHSGEIIETQVAGYIAGSDGKAGIRGRVASKDGQFLGRSLAGGLFSGLSSVANPANRKAQVNPFFAGNPNISAPSIGETFLSGVSQGAASALDRLSQYYIDRAEQLQPVIQVDAGQVVDIVFTEGTTIGDQSVKHKIEQVREDARTQTAHKSHPHSNKQEVHTHE